ncbi:YceI family protein [Pseudomonas sp. MLB6B]
MFRLSRLLPALCMLFCLPAHANWHLDGESSRVSFVTGKNGEQVDVHRFLVLHGAVDRKGVAGLRIEMDSVSSGTPLLDEQMRDGLFEVKRFADATVKTQIDLQPLNDLANGAQIELRLPVTVKMHGKSHTYDAPLLATRLDERRFQVVTLEPLVLRAADYDLLPGLERLRTFAKLKAINPSVPVNAVLIFTAR